MRAQRILLVLGGGGRVTKGGRRMGFSVGNGLACTLRWVHHPDVASRERRPIPLLPQ
jgi:hypothetical protein